MLDLKNKHTCYSLIKSIFRIIGFTILFFSPFYGVNLLIFAEIIGIAEEV